MKALKTIFLLIVCIFLSNHSFSQYYYFNDKYYNTDLLYEFGIGVGAMNSITDIGGANTDNTTYLNEINKKNNRFSKSIYAGVLYQGLLGARIEGTLGEVRSDDSSITGKSNNIYSKHVRNLSFRSKIAEVSLLLEFHPFLLLDFQLAPNVSPYVLTGLGWYHFNPQAELKGKWMNLQPLHTEGQGFLEYPDRQPYALSQFNIPMGVGLKFESGLFNVRVEYVHRRLFTDYLDDASTKVYIRPDLFAKYLPPADAANARALFNRTKDGSIPIYRGHSKNNDAFMTLSVKVGVVLGRERTGNSTGTRQLRCAFKF
ncbi:DUF6089 family protein [Segetibacter sp.]|jgi:hypothetical protein|uniref:DUF6089 family protein n=1 Tax=Segetibacter sp. TaxID=2231182 RepID=UPI00260EDA40|nr:DUF6089 family protein [Segetibacter sp.]MCW3082433.1 hypothetical protein [Segetibacter sp.]